MYNKGTIFARNKRISVRYFTKKEYSSFGKYVAEKRISKGIALLEMARLLGFSAPFWSDVEKGRANPPKYDKLLIVADILGLTAVEKTHMFDLAGNDRNTIAPDIKEYILHNSHVTTVFRSAIDLGVSASDWDRFINDLRQRKV